MRLKGAYWFMNPTPSLRDVVRQRTAQAHRALEAVPLMRAIAGGFPTEGDYRDYLAGHLWLHGPLEVALMPWVPKGWQSTRLIKAQWLLGDLLAAGGADQPAHGSPVAIGSEAEALGALYVLEGGTLGLQVVRKRMQATGSGPCVASRFMLGYGDATGSNWRDFCAQLDVLPKAGWPQALTAACATFSAFHRHFASLGQRAAP